MSLAKKLSSIFLSIVLIAGLLPYSAYADSASGTTDYLGVAQNEVVQQPAESEIADSAGSVDGDNLATASSSEEASRETGAEEKATVTADDTSSSLGMSAFEFIYVDQKTVSIGGTQSVAVSFVDHESAAGSVLYYQKQGGALQCVEVSRVEDGAALYEIAFSNAEDCGIYNLVKVAWSLPATGEATISNDTDTGYSFSVAEELSSESESGITAYSLDDSGNLSEESSLSDAISDVAESDDAVALAEDESAIAVASDDASLLALNSRSSKKMVIALDAGHGGSDSGATNGSLIEKDLNLSIARYCRDELKQYYGVTVYMVRDSDEDVDLAERVNRAVNAGADLFVSIHINETPGATGFEVWVQNSSSWNYHLHQESYALGNSILSKLSALGLRNRGNKESDSSSTTYADGSKADYLSVLRNSRYNNLPAVLVEHGFIDGASADQNLLSSEDGLRRMGIADAQGIAEQYGLTKGAPQWAKLAGEAHVSTLGWMSSVYDGETIGTTGQSRPLEALKLSLVNGYQNQGGFELNAHVSGTGWQGWTAGTAGTTGQSKAMEAVRIRLTGQLAEQYDVWYRVHSAWFGWMGWAKNGDPAGSQGYGRAAQAVQVVLVAKGGSAPGSADGAFRDKADEVTPIMGASEKTVDQMVAYYQKAGHSYPASTYASKGAPTLRDFCQIAYEEAKAEGVRAEVLFAQAMWETGWLQFGGDVESVQCNFGGLGATGDGAQGAAFANVRQGLRAQVQHLKAYASTDPLVNDCVDPRFNLVSRGCAPNLEDLNGRWAYPGDGYGQSIRSLIDSM